MIISYFHLLFMILSGQMIFYDHNAHLLYLVWFRFVSLRLEINYLLDAVLSENVVVSPDAF